MADKSAFVPVDAIANHKATDMDVDIDDELFGKKGPGKSSKGAAPAPAAKAAAPPAAAAAKPPGNPATATSAPAAAGKFQYKKATNYQKTYAGVKK